METTLLPSRYTRTTAVARRGRLTRDVPRLLLWLLLSRFHGPATTVSANPSIGNFTALVVLVQFPDHMDDRTVPSRDTLQRLCDNHVVPYLTQQSYGLYTIAHCAVQEWKVTNETEAYFANGVSNVQGPELSAGFAVAVLDALDEEHANDSSNTTEDGWWSQFDADKDGTLDAVLLLHSGYAAEQGIANPSECVANHPSNRLQSIGGPQSTNAWTNAAGTIRLNGYGVASVFERLCQKDLPATMGVMTHEWLHTVGAADLYDRVKRLGGVGNFDIMSNPFGPKNNGNLPGSLSPYSKVLTGWLDPTEILFDGVYELPATNRVPAAYVIRKGYADGEYLLIENRQLVGSDASLPGHGGLLLYHVDLQVWTQDYPGWPGQPGWPSNGEHYRVALLQADSLYDLEQGFNNGDAGDYFSQSTRSELLPGTAGFFPNTDSYQFGVLESTGIAITEISESMDVMTFRVSGLGTAPPTMAPTTIAPVSTAPTMSVVETTTATTTTSAPTASAAVGLRILWTLAGIVLFHFAL